MRAAGKGHVRVLSFFFLSFVASKPAAYRKARQHCWELSACLPLSALHTKKPHSLRSSTMCIILKLDLRCCRGCREWMCRNLKRVHGVEQVKVGDDEATIIVCGEGFDEAEIVRQVKKRKSRSEVEVVSRIFHKEKPPLDIDVGTGAVDVVEVNPKPKPKPKPKVSDGEEKQQSSSPRKVETLVTERMLEEFEGTKIRTRVTTSQDVCTCIRVEETHFIINKHRVSHHHKVLVNTLAGSL